MKDSSTRCRTFAKAISWEFISHVLTFLLALVVFGKIGMCLAFTVVSFLTKMILFYFHDRLWHQIKWGKR